MPNWQRMPLGVVCQLVKRGISPVYLDDSGVAVLNQKCVRNHTINLNLGRRHDFAAKKVPAERFLRAGDVLVNSTGTGTLGRVAQLRDEPSEPTTVDSHVTIVRPIKSVFFPDFFGYALIAIEDKLQQGGEGCGGQTELSRAKLMNDYYISYPTDLDEQRRITAILDKAFEGIGTAVANTEKNLANARELFENYLNSVFCEKGAGRTEKGFSEICEITSRLVDPREPEFIDLLHLGAGNMVSQTGEVIDVKTAREESLKSGKFLFDKTMVLYSKIRPYLMKACRPEFRGLCSADVYPLLPHPQHLDRDFLFYMLMSREFTNYAIAGSDRAGMPKVNRDHLFRYKVWLPPIAEQKRLADKLDAISAKCKGLEAIYQQKLACLAALKQSLLQKAFAGELTARSAQTLQDAAE